MHTMQNIDDMVPEELRISPSKEKRDVAVVFLLIVLGIALFYGFDWAIDYSLNRWGGI